LCRAPARHKFVVNHALLAGKEAPQQGPHHLVSPAMAAAIAGHFVDIREWR
jgi:homoaconitase/3-isopropylmalate dehydratase large subunit